MRTVESPICFHYAQIERKQEVLGRTNRRAVICCWSPPHSHSLFRIFLLSKTIELIAYFTYITYSVQKTPRVRVYQAAA
jgi:hypothetical protein